MKGERPMSRTHQFIATCFAVGLSTAAFAASARARRGEVVEVTDLQPFTHVAYIPADADLSSIKMESVKAVKVATRRRSVTNKNYCDYVYRFSDPGGSMYCPQTTNESPVPAYRVSYSYKGKPMASDEYASTYSLSVYSFSVYFRPDELNPALLQALSSGRVGRSSAAEFFQLTTSRGTVPETVIDRSKSRFCEGYYFVDGYWIHTNPKCEDVVAYKVIATPSPYITVKVNPTYPRLATVASGRQPGRK
jgi:hypothetical protein